MLVNSRCFPVEVIFNRHLADVYYVCYLGYVHTKIRLAVSWIFRWISKLEKPNMTVKQDRGFPFSRSLVGF